jgi:hypothetical protein
MSEPDWADQRARQWLDAAQQVECISSDALDASLATLLREAEQAGWIDGHTNGSEEMLAKVRGSVESVRSRYASEKTAGCADAVLALDEVLAELRK